MKELKGWATRLYWVDDNFQPLSVGTATGITRDYIFVGSQRIAFVPIATGNPYYYLSDHLGSNTVVASGDGKSIQWEGEFFPFGLQRTVITNLADNPYQFTGYEYDSGTGYNYAVARYDAGRWGRFLSPDPYMGSIDVTNPQSLNRYGYANNDPLNLVDPLGLDTMYFLAGGCIYSYQSNATITENGRNATVDVSAGANTLVFCEGGGSGGGSGGGGGGGGSSAPSKGFNKQAYNTCLKNFNQTSVGKVANFFSLASPLLGPERLHSTIEDVGGAALKYGAYTGLRYLENHSTQVITALGSGLFADIMHIAVADVVAPVAAISTALQVGVHAGCAAYSTPSLQPYLPPTF